VGNVTVARGPVNGNEIIAKIIKGAEKACLDYINLSGNPFPGYAPESFIQAGAARELIKLETTWVVLEDSVADAYKAAHPKKKGPSKDSVAKGRYDIVTYWKTVCQGRLLRLSHQLMPLPSKNMKRTSIG
jgi:hypothetical protein